MYKEKYYLEASKATGIKVGDRVKILRVPDYNMIKDISERSMARGAPTTDVGKIYPVVGISTHKNFKVNNSWYSFLDIEKVIPSAPPTLTKERPQTDLTRLLT